MHYIPTVMVKEDTRWEYQLVEKNSAEPITPEQLNKFGNDGWELIAVTPHKQHILYYFKRLI